MYGTIRMHQEREYLGRISATELRNPDALCQCISVERTEDFPDPQAITPGSFDGLGSTSL
jgi:hypothetical protein